MTKLKRKVLSLSMVFIMLFSMFGVPVQVWALEKEETPNAVFDAATMLLEDVEPNMLYSLDGGVNWKTSTGNSATISEAEVHENNGIYVMRPGSAGLTEDSDTQYITLTRAAAPDGVTAEDPQFIGGTGSLQHVNNTMEYRNASDSECIEITGSTVTGLEPAVYKVRVKGIAQQLPSEWVTREIVAFAAQKEPVPAAQFEAAVMELTQVSNNMSYSLDGGSSWVDIQSTKVKLDETLVLATHGILVKSRGDGRTTIDSDSQIIQLSKKVTPTGLTTEQPTEKNGTGSIQNVDETMEYRKKGDQNWTGIVGTSLTDLRIAAYEIRTKGEGLQLPSDIVEIPIMIASKNPYATPSDGLSIDLNGSGVNSIAISLGGVENQATKATITYDNTYLTVDKDVLTEDGFVTLTGVKAGSTIVKVTFEGVNGFDVEIPVRIYASNWGSVTTSGGGGSSSNRAPSQGTWMQDQIGWWIQKSNGTYAANEWMQMNGVWYWFDASGYMATGWRQVNNVWYFLNPNGAMVANDWTYQKGIWYFLNPNGAMVANDWTLQKGLWYYLTGDGSMKAGWQEWKGFWYYLNPSNGDMVMNTTTPDGYVVGADGKWIP